MSFSQVISAILMFAICNDAVVKATDKDILYDTSRQHELPVEQVKVEDSNRGDVPMIATFKKDFLIREEKVTPANKVHGSPVVVENVFPNRFFPIGGQDPVNRGVHQTDFRSGTPGSSHTQHYNLNIFVHSPPQVPGPYVYQSSSWNECVLSIPQYVSTISYGISTIKKAVRANGTFSHLDLEELLQMEGLLKCIRTLLHGIAAIRTASRTKGTFSNVDIEDIFTIYDILKLDDVLKCGMQVPGTWNVRPTNVRPGTFVSSDTFSPTPATVLWDAKNRTRLFPGFGVVAVGVEDLSVDMKSRDEDFSAPGEEPNALPPLACQCDCANSELRDVDNGGNGNRDIGALANMG